MTRLSVKCCFRVLPAITARMQPFLLAACSGCFKAPDQVPGALSRTSQVFDIQLLCIIRLHLNTGLEIAAGAQINWVMHRPCFLHPLKFSSC